MIEGLCPYPEMQWTGHPWLPAIPAHWEVRRNGRLFSERRETGYPDLPILEVSLRSGVRVRDMEGGKRKQQIMDRSVYQRAVKGDIAYNMMRMWQGAVGIAPADGLVSPAYVVAKTHEGVDAAYYAFLFRTDDYMKEVDSFSRGIVPDRNRLYWQAFKQMPSAYPPLNEQLLIVRFLDWHGAMTGKLIRAKRRLIALLKEQKQSVIHRAVTRGLDPAAKLKPSGVDWLGDVPEHWEVKRLKFACQVNPRTSTADAGERVTFLPMENVGATGHVDYSIQRSIDEVSTGYTLFQQCDVILAKITPCFENGKGAILSELPTTIGYGSTEFIVLRPHQAMRADYAYLLTVDPVFRLRGTEAMTGSAGQQRVSPDFVANWIIALPPEAEQAAICTFIHDHTSEFDAAINKVQSEITFIQEFRTRLIADVVTGQLDVRTLVASLPEVAEADVIGDLTDEDDLDEDVDALIDAEEAA